MPPLLTKQTRPVATVPPVVYPLPTNSGRLTFFPSSGPAVPAHIPLSHATSKIAASLISFIIPRGTYHVIQHGSILTLYACDPFFAFEDLMDEDELQKIGQIDMVKAGWKSVTGGIDGGGKSIEVQMWKSGERQLLFDRMERQGGGGRRLTRSPVMFSLAEEARKEENRLSQMQVPSFIRDRLSRQNSILRIKDSITTQSYPLLILSETCSLSWINTINQALAANIPPPSQPKPSLVPQRPRLKSLHRFESTDIVSLTASLASFFNSPEPIVKATSNENPQLQTPPDSFSRVTGKSLVPVGQSPRLPTTKYFQAPASPFRFPRPVKSRATFVQHQANDTPTPSVYPENHLHPTYPLIARKPPAKENQSTTSTKSSRESSRCSTPTPLVGSLSYRRKSQKLPATKRDIPREWNGARNNEVVEGRKMKTNLIGGWVGGPGRNAVGRI